MKISYQGLDLIKHFESLHDGDLTMIGLQPKMCPASIWTVGYGRALKDENGKWLKGEANKDKAYAMYPNLTELESSIMLDEDCDEREDRLNSINLNLTQYQFDALVSFIYNVGFTNFKKSTLLKKVKDNPLNPLIVNSFLMWNKARVKGVLTVLPGLTRRRMSEAHLFLTGELKFRFE